ncbi:hypothetical protein O3P69_009391 [Scylla paramamosain]|uniref:Uncharacterized protein n=1 Tax=Scylla paramamosain TaxID=85552 RepID=A0AAW0SU98_SCYPA
MTGRSDTCTGLCLRGTGSISPPNKSSSLRDALQQWVSPAGHTHAGAQHPQCDGYTSGYLYLIILPSTCTMDNLVRAACQRAWPLHCLAKSATMTFPESEACIPSPPPTHVLLQQSRHQKYSVSTAAGILKTTSNQQSETDVTLQTSFIAGTKAASVFPPQDRHRINSLPERPATCLGRLA